VQKELPAITGKQLIRLLRKDGFITGRKTKHGRSMKKDIGDRVIVTYIPETKASLPGGTLMAILGPTNKLNLREKG